MKKQVLTKDGNARTSRKALNSKTQQKTKHSQKALQNAKIMWDSGWRGVRDSNPRGPMDHRLSRPAPYQARATPQTSNLNAQNLAMLEFDLLHGLFLFFC